MKTRQIRHDERGAIAMITVISTLGIMGLLAFVIDLGQVYVARQELRNVADSAALAATRQMAEILKTKSTLVLQDSSFTLTSSERAQVIAAAANVAVQNKVGGQSIVLDTASDVSVGVWDMATSTFGPAVPGTVPDAVQVVARRDSTSNGPVVAYFAQMMGVNNFDVSAPATAALLPVGAVPPGGIGLPIGINDEVFAAGACGDSIKMYPTGTMDACAGWHTFGENANANNLNDILDDLNDGSGGILPNGESPAVQVGDSVNFVGGTISSALQSMQDLYDAKQVGGIMEGVVLVYDGDPSCSNPNQQQTVVGFAKVSITTVQVTGNPKEIRGQIQCEVINGRPTNGGVLNTLTKSGFAVLVS
jgi:Flp pilus assembly protein TadG